MDVSLSVRFTATERRERGAARRVPIDSDLWSERSTIHARHFASSIGRLSRALQMESYPKFHNESRGADRVHWLPRVQVHWG